VGTSTQGTEENPLGHSMCTPLGAGSIIKRCRFTMRKFWMVESFVRVMYGSMILMPTQYTLILADRMYGILQNSRLSTLVTVFLRPNVNMQIFNSECSM